MAPLPDSSIIQWVNKVLNVENAKKYVGPGAYDIKNDRIRNVSFDHAVRKTYVTEEAEKNKNPGPIYDVQ